MLQKKQKEKESLLQTLTLNALNTRQLMPEKIGQRTNKQTNKMAKKKQANKKPTRLTILKEDPTQK